MTTTRQLRAVVGARVSVVKGTEKVSHVAQHDSGVNYAERQGYEIVGAFEDLDVSAQVSPWDRADLGQWLTEERSAEWDAMIFAKIDRAFRSVRDCVKLAEWMQEHRKVLIFSDDGLTLDYHSNKKDRDISSMMSELFVYLGAFFAEIELERFRGRSIAAHDALRGQTRWTGGIAPDGYRIIDHPEGRGKGLGVEPERKALLNAMGDLVINGYSFNAVADWLNEEGYPTNQDYQRPENERRGTAWSATEVVNVLTTPATQGWKTTGGHKRVKTVLDDEGEPVRLAPPTFEESKWKELQEAIQKRKRAPYRTRQASPLSGVAYCWKCGKAASQHVHTKPDSGKQYRYYRCCNTPKACPRVRVRAELAEERIEQDFLEQCGDLPYPRWRFVQGSDNTDELERVNHIIDSLREDREMGLIVGEEDTKRYRERMRQLLSRRSELEALPQQKSGWVKEDTSETYREVWERSNQQGRRKILLESGIVLQINPGEEMLVVIPPDLLERMSA